MGKQKLAIVIDGAYLAEADRIVEAMRQRGLQVEAVQREIGAIFGTADEGVMDALRQIDGVGEVRVEGTVQLPPFSDDIPQ